MSIHPQLLWSRRVRTNDIALFLCGAFREYWDVDGALRDCGAKPARDFVPSNWAMYTPTKWDWATLLGSIGLFLTLQFYFHSLHSRMISISESRELIAQRKEGKALKPRVLLKRR